MGNCCSGQNQEAGQIPSQMERPQQQKYDSVSEDTKNFNQNKAVVVNNQLSTNNADDQDAHRPPANVAKLVRDPQNYSNPLTQQAMQKCGPFNYDRDRPEDKELPSLEPYEFENGAVYTGQWKFGMRHGRGKQSWTDGSYYEGYWKDNMANGYGRLIHADGDVYEGEWKDDKAHGKGNKKGVFS